MPYTTPAVTPLRLVPSTTTTPDGYTYPEIDLLGSDVPLGGTSYIDVTDADVYFSNSFNATVWAAIPPAAQAVALAEATRWLDTLCWKGEKCDPAQAMAWPRKIPASGCCTAATCAITPPAVIQATSELALALYQNQTAIVGGAASTSSIGAIKRQKLGDLEVEYHPLSSGSATTTSLPPSAPLVLRTFPWLKDLLGCYANFGANSLMLRVRS
jgi:hypothetical protein